MNRRSFLSLCGLAAGSCLVPDAVARVIRDTCVLADQPYLILPRNPKDIMKGLISKTKKLSGNRGSSRSAIRRNTGSQGRSG